ncbi:hypothetical protein [Oligoflexus tunisiensis]|uniref:hypothetical protein n=1 Tax=Oligoflexus tunisiensis TaxID=708132 RepID=UPI00114CF213|nr:hypothetical protein [Oligoflexus tunisiensis]
MRISYLASAFCLMLATGQASAYTSVTGVSSGGRLTGGLLLQDTDYETTADFNVETTQLMGGYKAALSPNFALGAGVGIVLDGELGDEARAEDGSGLRLFVDGQFNFKQWGANTLMGTFALTHDRYSFQEDFVGRNIDLDLTMTEIKIGGLFAHRISRASLYGGLEAYLFSDGEIDFGSANDDVERDNRLNIRLGGAFAVDPAIDLRADLYLLSEQTFLFAADFRL